jgi:predicted DCC family thiol-disulfide oxidoreductase YuxK
MAPIIILFDGVCNLCNRSVQFILRRDRRRLFVFASLQGSAGQQLLQKFGLPAREFNSFVLIENDKVYTRSSGALRVLLHLDGGWPLLYCLWIIPKPLRDRIYDWIARNRYRWFGRRESCWVPSLDLQQRFLDQGQVDATRP